MLYRLTPTLIEKGYVYIAESPLFEITTADRTYFAYDEPEKAKIMQMIGNKKCTVQRSKGLGENEPEMMSLTTMDPSTRRLIKVCPDDMEMTQWIMGNKVLPMSNGEVNHKEKQRQNINKKATTNGLIIDKELSSNLLKSLIKCNSNKNKQKLINKQNIILFLF